MSSSEFPLSNATNPLNQGFAVNQITDPTLLPKIGGEQTGSSSNLYSSLPVGTVHGLTGRYYNNYNDLGLIRTDATVDFNWGNGSPNAIIGKDNFRVDWTGSVQPLYSELYTFYTQSDDGARLRINDQLLIDKWQDQSTKEYSGSIFLEAGKLYNIDLDYYDKGGQAVSKLLWSSKSQVKQIIPTSQLYSTLPAPIATGTGNGLTSRYYNNTNFTDLGVIRTDAQINFDWGNGSPDVNIDKDTFSVISSGKIQPLYNEKYTFYTQSDDGGQLFINGQIIIDQWKDQSVTEHKGTITLEAGKLYDIEYKYYDNSGQAVSKLLWSSDSQVKQIIPTSQLYSTLPTPIATGTGNGLTSRYYNNTNFTDLGVIRTDTQINFDWGNGSPDVNIDKDTFSVTSSGKIQPLYNEKYTFYTQSDDGGQLFINGQIIIDQWKDQSVTEHKGTITLEAGKLYDIEYKYYDNSGQAVSKLLWSSDSQVKQIIPTSQLYSTLPTPIATGTGNGLTSRYYNNTNFTDLGVIRTDTQINFDWGNGSPDVNIDKDTFSVTSSGKIQPLYNEKYTFYTQSDDGGQLFINGQTIIDQWKNRSVTEHKGTITLEAGKLYDIEYKYYDNSGQAVSKLLWSSDSQVKQIIPTSQLYSTLPTPYKTGFGTGLRGEYFDNKDLTNSKLVRTDATIDFNWGKGSPDPSIGKDTFSATWTGFVQPLYGEKYTFSTQSDDGVRVWVNDQIIIDKWQDQSTREYSGFINLEAGKLSKIHVDYYENGGDAVSKLFWSSDSQVKQIIPTSQLYKDNNQPLIGIIDTGFVANNPDIDYSRITLGKDRVDNDNNPLFTEGEGNEHGTHILGIIAAIQDNDLGIDGINNDAPIWLGRAIGDGKWAESLRDYVDAEKVFGRKNGVINFSFDLTQKNADGTITTRYELTPEERAALEYARQNHILIVTAAGNNGGVMSVLGQASQEFDNIITVGAVDGDNRADYSSYGNGLDILADGGTVDNPILSTVGDGLGTMTGTSVAAAMVTGAASQIWAVNPLLSDRQIIEILKSTATDLNTPGWDTETGAGLLDMEAAIEKAKNTKAEVYNPASFLTPTTWGGDGLVTPLERAVDNSAQPNLQWVKQIGTPGYEVAADADVDSSGNIYVTGLSNPDTANEGYWVAKYDRLGNQLWYTERENGFKPNGIEVDNSGNVYIAGMGADDPRLMVYNTYGSELYNSFWQRTGYKESAYDIALDNLGNIYLTGFTEGALEGNNAGYADAWVGKFDNNGNLIWIDQLGTTSRDEATGIAVDHSGNVYISGSTLGSLGGNNLGSSDAWVAKYNNSGSQLWKRQLGSSVGDSSNGIAVDSSNNVYITGQTDGSLGGTNNGNSADAWFAKYDTNGNLSWKKQLGTFAHDESDGIAIDGSDNVYISGMTYGSFLQPGVQAQGNDAWIAKYTNNGTQVWIQQFGGTAYDYSLYVTTDNSGGVYFGGLTYSSLEGTQAGGGDAWIAKYSQSSIDDSTLSTARDLGILKGNQTLGDFVGDADGNDYYRFTVDAISNFNLTLDGLRANANVALLDSTGAIIQSSVNSGTTADSINRTLNPGNYYIRVYSSGTGANTSFNLSVSAIPVVLDNAGNDPNSALDLGMLNGTQILNDFVGDADIYDYYRFSLEFDSNFKLLLNGVSANNTVANPDVVLFRFNSNDNAYVPFGNYTLVNDYNTINTTLNAGTYLVRVGSNNSTIINSNYNLNLSANPIEAGNTLADARYIGILGRTQNFRESIGGTDTNDYYRFDLQEGSDFNLSLSGLNILTDLQILKGDGSTVNPINSLTGQQGTATLNSILSAGTYYVRIAPTTSGNSTTYDLSLSATSRSPRDLKINLGGFYGSGNYIYVTGKVYDPDGFSDLDQVYLKLNQESGQSKEYFITNFTPSQSDSRWAEFNYNLGRLNIGQYGWETQAFDKSGGKSGLTFTIGQTPVKVVYAPVDTAGETFDKARDLGTINGTRLYVNEFVGLADQKDVYKFYVPQDSAKFDGKMRVTLRLDGFSADADLALKTASGQYVGNSYKLSTNPENLSFDLAEGTYYVEVDLREQKDTNYTLRLTNSIPNVIALGQSASGELTTSDVQSPSNVGSFYDDYLVTGFNGIKEIKVVVTGDGFVPKVDLWIRSVDVEKVTAINYSIGNKTYIEYIADASDIYAVRVSSGVTGSYTIETMAIIDSTPNPNPDPITPPPPSTSTTINGFSIDGSFYPVYMNYQGTLGNPLENDQNYSSTISYQKFENGSIVSSSYGTYPIYGGIRQTYLKTGGLNGYLGAPKSAEIEQGNGTAIQYFANGYIYWNGQKATAYQTSDQPPVFDSGKADIGGSPSSEIKASLTSIRSGIASVTIGDPKNYVGPVWTVIKPETGNEGKKHLVTITWGAWQWKGKIEIPKDGLAIKYEDKTLDEADYATRTVTVRAIPNSSQDPSAAQKVTQNTQIIQGVGTAPSLGIPPLDIYNSPDWKGLSFYPNIEATIDNYLDNTEEKYEEKDWLNRQINEKWDRIVGESGQFEKYAASESPQKNAWNKDLPNDLLDIYKSLAGTMLSSELGQIRNGRVVGNVTSGYAYDKNYYASVTNQKTGKHETHAGLDIQAEGNDYPKHDGTPVKAATNGLVSLVKSFGSLGYWVAVDETGKNGEFTGRRWWYGHLYADDLVKLGKNVKVGETKIGNAGYYESHLHLMVVNTWAEKVSTSETSNGSGEYNTAVKEVLSRTMSPLEAYWKSQNDRSEL